MRGCIMFRGPWKTKEHDIRNQESGWILHKATTKTLNTRFHVASYECWSTLHFILAWHVMFQYDLAQC